MGKKIIGILMTLFAVAEFVSGILPGNSHTIFTTTIMLSYGLVGIFLITFDKSASFSLYRGYLQRKIQCVVLMVLWVPCLIVALIAVIVAIVDLALGLNWIFALLVLVTTLVYAFPAIVLSDIYLEYVLPYKTCKKNIINYGRLVDDTLVLKKNIAPCTSNASVWANDCAIFFRKQYCAIPLNMIKSYRYTNILGMTLFVFIKLTNGTTVYIKNTRFEEVKKIIDAHKASKA